MSGGTGTKTIAYFVGTHGDWGGASRIIFNIVQSIDPARFRPVVLLTARGPACAALDALNVRYEIWRHQAQASPLSHVRQLFRSLSFYRRNAVDLVSLAYGCLGWRPAEILAARLAGIPVIQHCQQVIRKPSPYTKHSRLILTCSQFVAEQSAFGRVPTRRLYDIVDTKRFGSGRDIRSELGVGPSQVVVTFLGRKRRSKGVDSFVALARALPGDDVRFLVAGQRTGKPNRDTYSDEEFDGLIAQEGRMRYVGYRDDIENLYASSDVIVMPSRGEEPCPAVALEAAASGRPIVAFDTGATRELVIDGETGFVVPRDDFPALVDATRRLVSNPQLRAAMGAKAMVFARTRFDRAPIEQLHETYDEVLTVRGTTNGTREARI